MFVLNVGSQHINQHGSYVGSLCWVPTLALNVGTQHMTHVDYLCSLFLVSYDLDNSDTPLKSTYDPTFVYVDSVCSLFLVSLDTSCDLDNRDTPLKSDHWLT